MIDRPADVTRSTVQKAVVVIAESPTFFFGHLKQQLSAVTQAWFAQRDFGDLDIIRRFQESLQISMDQHDKEREQYVGLSLREIVHEFKYQTLVLFKCMLLQPKVSWSYWGRIRGVGKLTIGVGFGEIDVVF